MHPVGELIPEDKPLTLSPRTSVLDACLAMRDARVGAVLVNEGDGPALGIFTERDLMTRVVAAGHDPAQVTLTEVMTRDLYFTQTDVPTSQVRREMRRRHIRHAPVLDKDNNVVAMLSMRDLLQADLKDSKQEVEAITQYIQGGLDAAN